MKQMHNSLRKNRFIFMNGESST